MYTWVGLELDLSTHALGIADSRACWLIKWINDMVLRGAVRVKDLRAVLGRLSFAAGPLERIKPFFWHALMPGSLSSPTGRTPRLPQPSS